MRLDAASRASAARQSGRGGLLRHLLPRPGPAQPPGIPAAWRRSLRVSLFALGLLAGLVGVLTFQLLPSRYDLREGDVSVYTVKSPHRVTFVSQLRTREARQAAAAAAADVYTLSPALADQQRQRAVDVLTRISELRRSSATLELRRDAVNRMPDLILPPATIDDLLLLDEPDWQAVAADTLRVLDRVMRNRIAERQLEDVRASIPALVDPALSNRQATAAAQLARNFVRPNFLIDIEATAARKREAQERVEPVRLTIERGEVILRDGEKVGTEALEVLQAAGLRNPTFRWKDALAMALLIGLPVLLLTSYVVAFHPAVADDHRRLLVLGLLVVLTALAAKLTVAGRDVGTYWAYLFPVAAASMLVAVLLDVQLALAVTGLLAVGMGLITSASFELATLTLVGGTVGALAVSRLQRLTTLFRAGVYVAAANSVVSLGFALFSTEVDTQRLALLAAVAIANGLLAAGLALSAVYLLGHVLEITTAMSMLELAHPSQPLFRRLLVEAPGTYHHSVVVANLAERAAEVVGADALLCRIGAYYHDIGKLARPYAFIENQVDGQNVHDQLDPATSARIIVAHVADGLTLARRHGVPRRVQDVIAQHHGTGLAGFFHRRACQNAGCPVDETPFRYPGPRPQSREAGIMMLADSVEAAVRAHRDHSAEGIGAVVQRIVQDRIADGQLDDCALTLRDLERIREAFAAVLQGIFHPRIEYPTPLPQLRAVAPALGASTRSPAGPPGPRAEDKP